MKKFYLSLLFLAINFVVYSQFTVNQTPYYDKNVIKTDHSIFQITPDEGRLTLQISNKLENSWTRGIISSNIFWDATNSIWKNTANSSYRDFSMIRFENGGSIGFFTKNSVVSPTPLSITNSEMDSHRAMTIHSNQNVGIGSLNPDAKLTVKGKIHCEEVIVDLAVPADYVFEKYYNGFSYLKPDYTMPTLLEVEAYTKEYKHLPNVPSNQEIKENGLHIKEMTNILLQKIEELTLYTIEQEKRINALEATLNEKKIKLR